MGSVADYCQHHLPSVAPRLSAIAAIAGYLTMQLSACVPRVPIVYAFQHALQAVAAWKDLGSLRAATEYVAGLPPGIINVSFSTAGLGRIPSGMSRCAGGHLTLKPSSVWLLLPCTPSSSLFAGVLLCDLEHL